MTPIYAVTSAEVHDALVCYTRGTLGRIIERFGLDVTGVRRRQIHGSHETCRNNWLQCTKERSFTEVVRDLGG